MNANENKVIRIIDRHCKLNDSAAYFELVCKELFGEFNEENGKMLNEILEKLEEENFIEINGDRLHLKKELRSSDFIIHSYQNDVVEMLEDSGVKLNSKSIDIGHGCNVQVICTELIDKLPPLMELVTGGVDIGVKLAAVKAATEGYSWLLKTIREVKEEFTKLKKEKSPEIYFNDDGLLSVIISEILLKYKFKIEDIDSLKLIDRSKIKVGALGYYAIKNYNYSEISLEGSPQSINYYAIELRSSCLESDSEIIRCEILSNGTIKYFDTMSVSTCSNF